LCYTIIRKRETTNRIQEREDKDMTNNINVNAILAQYTEEVREELKVGMMFLAMAGASNAPKTDEEFQAWCEEIITKKAEEEAKKNKAKETKLANEIKKATEMGLTLEEYKKFKNAERNAKRVAKEVKELKADLARKQAYLKRLEKEILQYALR
jgi:hypothetical protein